MEELRKTAKDELMSMRLFINILFLFLSNIAIGQNKEDKPDITGKYTTRNPSHTNPKHYEEITLEPDSTFKYYSRIGDFIRQEIEGKWSVTGNYLVLNENGVDKKLVVNESYDPAIPKGWIKFSVQHFDNSSLNYRIAAANGDTTIILKDQFKSSLLPLSSVGEFYIEGSLFRYPTYQVKDEFTNHFFVKLSSKRLFIDEKWLVEGAERLRPIGLNNEYAGYFLLKD